jgi:hypothetical protein
VGWQDRDWAKWDDDERRRFFGGGGGHRNGRHGFAPGAFLAVVVSLVALVMAQSQGVDLLHLNRAHGSIRIPIAPLYGTGVVESRNGAEFSCTAVSIDLVGEARCTYWTYLFPGERALQAEDIPARGTCAAAEADQISRSWVCTAPAAGTVNS